MMLLIQRGDYPTPPDRPVCFTASTARLPGCEMHNITAIVRFSIETKQSRSFFPKLEMLYNQ